MKKVFFIGICGISMSALAVLLKSEGNYVCGMDKNVKTKPKSLEIAEIKVVAEKEYKIIKNFDVVVYSSAIRENDKALVYARKLGKLCISRGELLGSIASNYEKVVAVAGSHGKTTTTAMIYSILHFAGKSPTLHLGGILKNEQTNVVIGGNEFLITEACEYHDNFLYLNPYVAVVTNVEKEHMDYFLTFEREKQSFQKFKDQSLFVIDELKLEAKNIKINKQKGVSFDVYENGEKLCKINLKIGGFYNVTNALFAMQTCIKLGISVRQIKMGLEQFEGTRKRLDFVKIEGKDVVVDYAHHPTEIKNALLYLKKLNKNLILIFQPHTYSRTKNLLKDFVRVLTVVDQVYIYKTYEAREKKEEGISGEELANIIRKRKKECEYIDKVEEVKKILSFSRENDLDVIMGAGDLPEKLKIY